MTSEFRPVAYVSVTDPATRRWIIGVLERAGWLVIPQPSAATLLRALASVREYPWLKPGLVIIDTPATAAEVRAGLRELGLAVPVVEHGRVADVVGARARPGVANHPPLEHTA